MHLLNNICCPRCLGELNLGMASPAYQAEWSYRCRACQIEFPIIDDIPRMLLPGMLETLVCHGDDSGKANRQVQTAQSFGFEWQHFSEMYEEWERNFLEYMQPHDSAFFRGKRVLDAGCGSGRHAYYAAAYGADVWAVDLGPSVGVARRNTTACGRVQVIQADLYQLPFPAESFDFVYSIGVLHHLPDPEAGFRNLLNYVKPGGAIQIYLYWAPEQQPIKRSLLAAVSLLRRLTMRLPYRLLYTLSYPAAWIAYAGFVWPYQILSRMPGLKSMAEKLPLKQYAQYPFRVCVNDQFDRFSAPIEHRYTRVDVEAWMALAGLEQVCVIPNFGWIASGVKP